MVSQIDRFRARDKTRVLAILLCALLLSACLVRAAYNNADWLLVWELDSSFDLTRPQKQFIKERVREHLRWHRETELAKTIAFLRFVQESVSDGLTNTKLQDAVATFASLRNTLATRLALDSAAFFAQVSDAQLEYLQKSFNKSNKDWERRAKMSSTERRVDRTERVLDIITDWVGPLSDAQEQKLTPAIEAIPDVQDIWLMHTKQRQRQFVELVRSARDDRATAASEFVAWIKAESAPPELNAHRTAIYQLVLDIDALCTATQHQHFNRKLQEWIDDLELAHVQGAA